MCDQCATARRAVGAIKQIPGITHEIGTAFVHCQCCIDELPEGTSPREFARLNVSVSDTGLLQVWCTRHEKNVVVLALELEGKTA